MHFLIEWWGIYSDVLLNPTGSLDWDREEENQTQPESLEGNAVWEDLRQKDRVIYEAVTQHYSVATNWTIINTANEHRGAELYYNEVTVGESH